MRRSSLVVAAAAVAVSAALIAVIAAADTDDGAAGGDAARHGARVGGCASGAAASSRARVILRCVAPSLAFVSSPLGTGSGILVDDRYVVTNAHVVDPFGMVDLVFGQTEHHRDVPVTGVDFAADLALVGPVDTARRPLPVADYDRVHRGDDVYLVGYPGEVDDEPEATISRGILSRTRRARGFDLTFLQTDAAIGGGQSGGALVDDGGQVVGVSGFSFAEEFALALSGRDTRRAIRHIRNGDTAPYVPFPPAGATTGAFDLAGPEDAQVLTLHTRRSEEVRLDLAPELRPAVYAADLDGGDVYFQNQEAVDAAREAGEDVEGTDEVDVPETPGVYKFEVPANTYAVIQVGTRLAEGAHVAYTSNVALGRYDDADDDRPIEVGERVQGTIDPLELAGDTYVVDLEQGEQVDVFAGSATGDVGYEVRAPGQTGADATYVDDSGLGLFGADARDVYVADASGPHRITVYSADGTGTGYVLEVLPA
ncbi:MAG TPA: serine protease [Acidimicrobiales bacterium]|nr:serine protease [Acidimicrobiales bacterium]